jgi:MFS family permease
MSRREIDSPYAWFRLAVSVLLSAIGGVGMWSVVVVLPAVQAEFGAERGAATLPFILTMIGFGVGGVIMGRVADRKGIVLPVMIGAVALGAGYIAASMTTGLWSFAAAYLLIGTFGTAATFVPLISDISFWFERRRGIAVALCASGNYVSGAIWPTFLEWMIRAHGWRTTHVFIGLLCLAIMPPLTLLLRSRPPVRATGAAIPVASGRRILLPPAVLQTLLAIAGLACCVAMSMPQVHIVAYCGDLGYGPARGAQMLSLMLGFGIVSRIGTGFLADRIGGLRVLLIGSIAQGTALFLFLFFDGLTSLYVISAMFGLFQGGIVPSYAIIVRESMPAQEAATRVGIVIFASVIGMSFGGWISGVIFDHTGSYGAAFLNGLGWNALNITIALALLYRARRRFVLTPSMG